MGKYLQDIVVIPHQYRQQCQSKAKNQEAASAELKFLSLEFRVICGKKIH
jgi:hypothetical protein